MAAFVLGTNEFTGWNFGQSRTLDVIGAGANCVIATIQLKLTLHQRTR